MGRIGWIGLGAMGGPMARVAADAGFALDAYDVDPARVPAHERIAAAASVADAARAADVVVLMVATEAQAEEALGEVPAGALLLVMSTVGPEAVRRWARDRRVVDAPVSGGVARAGSGDLLIMVAGDDALVARVRPLLDALARDAPTVGTEPGDGQKVKLVNQLLCGVHIAAAGEALAFAEALGLDARACWEVIRGGAAASFMLDDRGERMLDSDFDEVRSALAIFVKDMGLVTHAAEAAGYVAPLAALAERLYAAGAEAGLERRDDASIVELYRAGTLPA